MLSLRVALRYLLAPKTHKAVNVISIIAVAGVAVATMAIVVVLSVFNGFSALSARHLALIDPDLKVMPARGKVFGSVDSLRSLIEALPEVDLAVATLQERALAVAGERQMPVVVKGVETARYTSIAAFDSMLVDGIFVPDSSVVCVAVGPAMELNVRPSAERSIKLYVPRRRGRINPANPSAAYREADVYVSGIFAVDQAEYDADFVIADIDLLRDLLDYDHNSCGALELKLRPDADAGQTAAALGQSLGSDFEVLTRMHQQPDTFKMISVEKWVTFLMMIFILIVASFNIITTLSLMVIEKRSDMGTLRALGASRNTVAAVFAWEGTLITWGGGLIGVLCGTFLAWLQQSFGLIKLAADPTTLTIDVYPVEIAASDVLTVAATVVVLGFILGQVARLFTRKT